MVFSRNAGLLYNRSNLVTVLALFLLSVTTFAVTSHSTRIDVTVNLQKIGQNDVFQVFYDTRRGFNEGESDTLYFLKTDSPEQLKFNLNTSGIRKLRIDPGTRPGTVFLESIVIRSPFKKVALNADALHAKATQVFHIASISIEKNILVIVSSGNDPQFVLDDFGFHFSEKIGYVFAILSVLFSVVVVYLGRSVISSFYTTNGDYSILHKFRKQFDGLPERRKDLLVLIALLTLTNIILNGRLIFGNKYMIFIDIGGDTFNSYYPMYYFLTNLIRDFNVPAFSFNISLGNDIFTTLFYAFSPFSVIYLMAGSENIPQLIIFNFMFKITLSAVFMYLYLTYMKINGFHALLCSIAFAFNGHIMLWGQHYFFSDFVALLPLLMFSFERLYTQSKGILFSFTTAMMLPNIYLFFPVFFLLFFYFVFRVLCDPDRFQFRSFIKRFAMLFLYGAIGAGLSAVLYFPLLYLISNSPRVSISFMTQISNIVQNFFALNSGEYYLNLVFRLFSNNITGTGKDYFGFINYYESPIFFPGSVLCFLLIPQLFCKETGVRKLVLALILLTISLAMILPSISVVMNGFQHASYRWGYIVIFPTLLLAGLALKKIQTQGLNRKLLLFTLCGSALLLVVVSFFSFRLYPGALQRMQIVAAVALVMLFLISYYLAFTRASFKIRTFQLTIVVILIAEVLCQNYFTMNNRILVNEKILKRDYLDGTHQALDLIDENELEFYRIDKNYSRTFNASLIQGYRGLTGYNSFDSAMALTRTLDVQGAFYTQLFMTLDQRPHLSQIMSTRYLLTKDPDSAPNFFEFENKLRHNGQEIYLFKNLIALPLGFTYDKFICFEDFEGFDLTQKDNALLQAVVVERDSPFKNALEEKTVSDILIIPDEAFYENKAVFDRLKYEAFKITEFQDAHIKGRISIEDGKLLFFSIPFSDGWKLKVNGQNRNFEKVNVSFIGVYLEGGEYEIELRYANPYFKAGVEVSLICLLLIIIIYTVGSIRNKFRVIPGHSKRQT